MNKYFNYWKETLGKNDRDNVFLEVLNYFNNQYIPIILGFLLGFAFGELFVLLLEAI